MPPDQQNRKMTDEQHATITTVVKKMPDWIRRDLLSNDAANRQRAEDALAARIAVALRTGTIAEA